MKAALIIYFLTMTVHSIWSFFFFFFLRIFFKGNDGIVYLVKPLGLWQGKIYKTLSSCHTWMDVCGKPKSTFKAIPAYICNPSRKYWHSVSVSFSLQKQLELIEKIKIFLKNKILNNCCYFVTIWIKKILTKSCFFLFFCSFVSCQKVIDFFSFTTIKHERNKK